MDSPQGHKPCQQTCSGAGSSLHWSAGPGRSLLQHGLPTRSQLPSDIHLLRHGVLPGLQVEICSTVDLHGLQGNLCSGAWSTSSPSFFTDLGVCRVVSPTYSHSSLLLHLLWCRFFYTFSNMLSQRRYHRCQLAQLWPVAAPCWSRLALALSDMGEASAASHTSHPCSSFTPKNLACKPNTEICPKRQKLSSQNSIISTQSCGLRMKYSNRTGISTVSLNF